MIEPLASLLEVMERLLDQLAGLHPVVIALATFALTALETTALIGLVIPGDAVVLLAGSTVESPAQFLLVLAATASGTYTGELLGYAIGRWIGPRLRTSRFGRLLGTRRWAMAEAYLAGRGAPILVPVRFVSFIHAVAPVVAGTVRMPLRRFATWAGIGALLWATVYTTLGTAAGAAYREYGELGLLTSVAVVVATVLVIYTRRLWRRWRRWRRRTRPGQPAGETARRQESAQVGPRR
jgi:membrane-associated protein